MATMRQLFFLRHASTHSRAMYDEGWWKEEDKVCGDLQEAELRYCHPENFNSIIWVLWHMARCEDVAVNTVLRNQPEVLDQGNWLEQLGVDTRHIGTGATRDEVVAFSRQVDIAALRAYRAAVGRETRSWVETLDFDTLDGEVGVEASFRAQERGAFCEAGLWVPRRWAEASWSRHEFLWWLAIDHNWFHIGDIWVVRSILASEANIALAMSK